MRVKSIAFIFVLLIVFPAFSFCDCEISPQKRKAIVEYINLSYLEQIWNNSLSHHTDNVRNHFITDQDKDNETLDFEEKVTVPFLDAIKFQKFQEVYIQIINEQFTIKELQEINKFFSTDIGRRFAQKNIFVSQKLDGFIAEVLLMEGVTMQKRALDWFNSKH